MFEINKFLLASIISLFIFTGVSHHAFAGDPVTLNITGNVVATPCEISSESKIMAINLGGAEGKDLQTADLNAAGSASEWIPFSVKLENCPAGTASVTATFQGTPDPDDVDTLYSNTGGATHVAVQLEGKNEEPYGNGKTSTLQIQSSSVTWDLQTRAFSKAGGVTPGSISSVILMNLAYQ